MVNRLTEKRFEVMSYHSDLSELIDRQVGKLIKDVMRPQNAPYSTRSELLQEKAKASPISKSTDKDDGTTELCPSDGNIDKVNNNPDYKPNMIDRLNTPFDHIERVLL